MGGCAMARKHSYDDQDPLEDTTGQVNEPNAEQLAAGPEFLEEPEDEAPETLDARHALDALDAETRANQDDQEDRDEPEEQDEHDEQPYALPTLDDLKSQGFTPEQVRRLVVVSDRLADSTESRAAEAEMRRLRFTRWLIEHGVLDEWSA